MGDTIAIFEDEKSRIMGGGLLKSIEHLLIYCKPNAISMCFYLSYIAYKQLGVGCEKYLQYSKLVNCGLVDRSNTHCATEIVSIWRNKLFHKALKSPHCDLLS